MSYRERNGIWSVHYLDSSGKHRQKSCGRGEEGEQKAKDLDERIKQQKQAIKEACREADVEASTTVLPYMPDPANTNGIQDNTPSITFGQLVNEYLAHSQVNGSTDGHRRSILYIAEKLYYPHFGKNRSIRKLTYGHILEFMAKVETENSRNGRKRSVVTTNRYGHFLNAFFRYAVDLGYLDRNPMSRWKPRKTPPKEVKLTMEDFQKIMDYAPPHLKWALEVEYHLGLRSGPSELLSLKWEDMDLDNGEAHIYAPKTKTYRTIPIKDEKFLEALRERRDIALTPYVIEYDGKPVKSLKVSFNRAVKLANLPYPVRMYDVRHLFATMLVSDGAPIGAVSALLGHSRTSTTVNVYYHATKAETLNAIDKLPALR